jgi:zinc transport system substrate-binding protein
MTPVSLWRMMAAGACLLAASSGFATAQVPAPAGLAQPPAHAINVVVTIPPVQGLVSPMLPEGSTIRSLMPPGRSEHGYEFTPTDLVALAKADLVVLVGLGLESRIEQELKDRPIQGRIVLNLGDALGLVQVAPHDHDHAHGEACDHDSTRIDQHVWLDPVLVESLIPKVKESIAAVLDSQGAAAATKTSLDEKSQAWTRRVAQMHESYTQRLEPLKGRVLVTHHNAFSRIAQRYGLTIAASIRELDDAEPTPSEVAAAVRAIKSGNVRAVFVEPQMNQAVPRRLAAAAKVKVDVLDPLGDGDWCALMEKNLDALVRGLGDDAAPKPAAPKPAPAPAKDPAR